MEGEHTSTIIQLILLTDLAVIQLKNSHLILHISQHDVKELTGTRLHVAGLKIYVNTKIC